MLALVVLALIGVPCEPGPYGISLACLARAGYYTAPELLATMEDEIVRLRAQVALGYSANSAVAQTLSSEILAPEEKNGLRGFQAIWADS